MRQFITVTHTLSNCILSVRAAPEDGLVEGVRSSLTLRRSSWRATELDIHWLVVDNLLAVAPR